MKCASPLCDKEAGRALLCDTCLDDETVRVWVDDAGYPFVWVEPRLPLDNPTPTR